MIENQPDMKVVGEAEEGQKVVDLAKGLLPDVIIMDISMPNLNGFEATRLILDENLNARNGVYTAIALKKTGQPGILEVSGGDVVLHVIGDIQLGNSCEIIVKEDTTLKIYTDGDIVCALGSGINTEAPPEQATTLR